MIDRGLAIFSGFNPKVVARLSPSLRSVGIAPVSVALNDPVSPDYFERLAAQALHAADRERSRGDVRLTSVLISALDGIEIEAETEAFFPALRRVFVRPEWRNNPSAAGAISRIVQGYFESQAVREFSRRLAVGRENRMLMPRRNTPAKTLNVEFQRIYHREADALSSKIEKDIVALRGSRAFKTSSLTMTPALNSGKHPVRRCIDSSLCDLRAAFRFGADIHQRFEFDITSDNGLKGKTFSLCDGTSQRITSQTSHLNMRINDDFKEA